MSIGVSVGVSVGVLVGSGVSVEVLVGVDVLAGVPVGVQVGWLWSINSISSIQTSHDSPGSVPTVTKKHNRDVSTTW